MSDIGLRTFSPEELQIIRSAIEDAEDLIDQEVEECEMSHGEDTLDEECRWKVGQTRVVLALEILNKREGALNRMRQVRISIVLSEDDEISAQWLSRNHVGKAERQAMIRMGEIRGEHGGFTNPEIDIVAPVTQLRRLVDVIVGAILEEPTVPDMNDGSNVR